MSIQIVPMTLRQIPACASIMTETPLWKTTYGVTEASARNMLQVGLADPQQTLCTALDEDMSVVGFAYFVERGAFYYGSYLRLLAVQPACRSQGIGEKLLRHVESAVGSKSRHLFLMVTEHNMKAQRFYKRLGYKHVGTVADFVVSGVTECIFCKRLT
jgi:ribosomal protein S18 acetylase RimI-like enzyme